MRAPLLQGVDLFARLAPADLEELAAQMQERSFAANDVLLEQGAAADRVLVILDGTVELSRTALDGRVTTTHPIGEGDSFGEIEMLSGEPSATTARALTDTRALVLLKQDFEAIVSKRPWMMRTVLAGMARRVSEVNRELVTDADAGVAPTANGRVVAVFSPRGGAGTTIVAVNLALLLAESHPGRVALFDLDLLFGDAAYLLDASPALCLANVPERELGSLEKRLLPSLIAEHESQLRVIVAAMRPEDGERVTGGHVRAALTAMRRQAALTIVDCGSSLAEPALVPLELADRVLMVSTPDLASLRDVRDCLRLFSQALHVDRQRVLHCLNHPLPVAGLTRSRFEGALEQPIVVEIPHAGDAAARGVRLNGHPSFRGAIEHIAQEVLPPELMDAVRVQSRRSTPVSRIAQLLVARR